jgi:hypothetical protein
MKCTWLEPWEEVPEQKKVVFQDELVREVTATHPLFGLHTEPIGRSLSNDDVLFKISGESRLAVVHLTWSGSGNHTYPLTKFFDEWDDFANDLMAVNNLDYNL